VWDVETGEERRTLQGHAGWVNAVVLSADGKTALSGLQRWDPEGMGRGGGARSAARSGPRRRSECGGAECGREDGPLRLQRQDAEGVDVETGEERRTLRGHAGGVNAVALSAGREDGPLRSSDRTLKVWDAETGEERRTLEGHNGRVNAVVAEHVRKDGPSPAPTTGH